ncbi:MAG: phosphate ABC transporter permease subunit PstC [Candidatus Zixiibacteriota bacterium]|jgi:phosphate ABC transporter permease protein PstC
MRRNWKKYIKYAVPAAMILLSFAVKGVIGWLLFWGGLAALGGQLANFLAARFFPRRVREGVINVIITAAGYSTIVIIAFIFLFIFKEGFSAFREVPFGDFFKTIWQPASEVPKYGIIPLATGTAMVTLISMIIAIPLGLGTAIYLSEIAGAREREIVKPVVELLSAIPSVVYGLLGMVVLGDVIPAITGTPFRLNAVNGGLVLAVMLTPMLASLAEDALYSVPRSYRVGSFAMGATRWEVIRRTVVPAASSGVTAAVLLSVARTLGETMAVLLATGNMAAFTVNPLSSVRTMTATIAIEMGDAVFGGEHYHVLFALGVVLFSITFVVNLASQIIMDRYARKFR